jgi:hypothetical protein
MTATVPRTEVPEKADPAEEKFINVLLLESEDLNAIEEVLQQDGIKWRKINSFMYRIEDSRLRTSLLSLKLGAEGKKLKLSFEDSFSSKKG